MAEKMTAADCAALAASCATLGMDDLASEWAAESNKVGGLEEAGWPCDGEHDEAAVAVGCVVEGGLVWFLCQRCLDEARGSGSMSIEFSSETCCTDTECDQWPNRHRCEGEHEGTVLADGCVTVEGLVWYLCQSCIDQWKEAV